MRNALISLACIGTLLVACSQTAPDQGSEVQSQETVPTAEIETASTVVDTPELPSPDTSDARDGFDIASVPVSDVALGDFPYFTLPDGYHHPNRAIPMRDFDRVAVWTGDRLEWVEGRVFESLVHADRKAGKGFSRVEVMRNIDHQVGKAGGTMVTDSRVPREIIKAWDEGQEWSQGRGDVYNSPAVTWLVRRADRNIWINFVSNNTSGSWMVVESAAFEPTAQLLPSSELRQKLDADGRVAIQIQFDVDKAEILPASQPQIDQVAAMLEADTGLQLAVEGHTDNTGTAEHNRSLSDARAQSVMAALVAKGTAASRLSAEGFGQDKPIADNGTEEGRARNRRVELVRR